MEEMLSSLPGVTSVHSRFYDLSSKYYQTVGSHASYYKDALRFLGCVDIKDLPGEPTGLRALGWAGSRGRSGKWLQLWLPRCPFFGVQFTRDEPDRCTAGALSAWTRPRPEAPGNRCQAQGNGRQNLART